jgi:transposase
MADNNASTDVEISSEFLETCEPVARAIILALVAQVKALKERVRDLEAKLGENSSNSSKPPSSDAPWAKPIRVKKRPTGRRPGGQPGHPPHQRKMFPPEDVTITRSYHPGSCAHCSASFEEGVSFEELEPQCHQVVDIPALKPFVAEHRLHVRRCGRCKGDTVAAWPVGLPRCSSGPRLQAWVGALTVRFRLSKREAQNLLRELVGVAVSLGGISDIEQYLSEALAAPVAEVQSALQSVDAVGHDETGWRQENQKAWLWTTVSENYAVYKIDLKRSGEVARSLLNSTQFLGTVTTDRYKAYNCYPMERRQICHAHLARDYKKIADREGPGEKIGKQLCVKEAAVFTVWHSFKAQLIDRETMSKKIETIATKIKALLIAGGTCDDSKVEGMCNDILKYWPAMWTFTRIPGIEPTNNASERAVRPYVLWRKGNFGTQSPCGSRFMERMMTVIQSCRLQSRHLISFLIESVHNWNHDIAAPSLLAKPTG